MLNAFNIIFSLVGKKFKFFFYFLILFFCLTGILELFSISLLVPFLGNFLNVNLNFGNSNLNIFINFFNNIFNKSLLMSLIAIIFFFIIKNFFSICAIYLNYLFSFKLAEKIKLILLNNILNQEYFYFLDKDISSLTTKIYNNSQHISNNFINPILSIITEFFILFFLLLLLFFIEPKGTLLIFSFFFIVIFIYIKFINKKFKKLGETLTKNDKFLFKYLEQSFSNIKETLIYNRQNYFEKNFTFYQKIITNVAKDYLTFQQFPRIFLEILVLISVAFLVIFLIYLNVDKSLIFIKIGIFSAVAFKILPSINRLVFSYHSIKFGKPLVNSALNEINFDLIKKQNLNGVNKAKTKLNFKKSIVFQEVSFNYVNNKKSSTISNISLEINKGDIVLISGKTGSGKSTIMDLLTGLLVPSEGRILIDDINLADVKKEWQLNIGFISQHVYLSDASIKENIIYDDLEKYHHDYFIKSLKDANIYDYIQSLPDKENTLCGEKGLRFSGGQKQRIAIARALYRNPSVLIMDEATTGLDHDTEQTIFNNLVTRNITVVIISHNILLKKYCNKMITVEKGKVI